LDTSDYLPYIYQNAAEYNLMIAAGKGYPTEIERLIRRGADINAMTTEGVTPLIFAVANNKSEAVSALLVHDPELDNFTIHSENALFIAVKNDFLDVAEKLIRAGANIIALDRYNATPLHYSSLYGFTEMTDMLIYYDAEINAKTSDGSTPLLGTVWAGNISTADLLIQNGARLEERNNEGFTPFLLASYFSDTIMMDLLMKNGADIFARTDKGYNALSLSIMSEITGGADYLLRLEKNWSGLEKSNSDPYMVAAKYSRKDIIDLLHENNVPGKVRYMIDQVAFSITPRFSAHDFYSGFSLTFKEPYLNAGFVTGLDTKLWYTRVLEKVSDDNFNQYFNRGHFAYAGLFKDFQLTNSRYFTSNFSAALYAGYSFGNELKGTATVPDDRFKLVPSASFKWTYMNLTFKAGVDYIKSDFYRSGTVWIRAGVGYIYYFDNIRTKIKIPKWY
jgi:ankyrin repeat protein